MCALTETELPTEPLTGSVNALYALLDRLRTLTRIAGLHLTLGYPNESPGGDRLPLGDVDEATVRDLAAILTPVGAALEAPHETNSISGAAAWLQAAAQAAGIDLFQSAPASPKRPDGQDRLPLGNVNHDTATRLADVIEQHLADLYTTEDALRTALAAVGVTADQLSATGGVIEVGDITVPEAGALLRHLAPGTQVQATDPDDQRAGEDLATGITEAIRAVTGGFIDAAYTPYCRRCRSEAAILLGKLEPPHAKALTAYLTRDAA